MNLSSFNAALAIGWLLLVAGLAMWSVPLALVGGGGILIGLTLLVAFRAGVAKPGSEG